MWACMRGHIDTAVMLYKWNHTALNIKNFCSNSALEVAKQNNHLELAKELEDLESRRDKANMLLQSNNNNHNSANNNNISDGSPLAISPASSVTSLASITSTSKSHDGVFLRPGVVTRYFCFKYNLAMIYYQFFSHRSESQKFSRMLNLDFDSLSPDSNIIGSNKMLSSIPSPSYTEGHSNRGQRLIKRPSIDSGIHTSTDSLSSLRSKNKLSFGREIPKLSRFDRSMSLPLNSPNQENSSDMESLEIGNRKDFALCKYNFY